MHSSHPQADNLFSRLFSYTPREGRESIEDYNSETFAREFLRICKLDPGDEELHLDIHTQNSFSASGANSQGRFDLVIESHLHPTFVVVIEAKFEAKLWEIQLRTYKTQLDSKDFDDVPKEKRYLVTLTSTDEKEPDAHANILWSNLQPLLASARVSTPDRHVAETMRQFAAFLEQRGLAPLQLMKTTSEILSHWHTANILEMELKQIVSKLGDRKKLKGLIGRNRVRDVEPQRIAILSKNFLVGFGIAQVENEWELFMLIEIGFEGNRLGLKSSIPAALEEWFRAAPRHVRALKIDDYANLDNLSGPMTWFAFSKTVDQQLNGNANAIFDVLCEAAERVVDFYNENRLGRKVNVLK